MKSTKKEVISLAVDAEIKKELLKIPLYTVYIQNLIKHGLEYCPTCNEKLKKSKKTFTARPR